MTLLTDVSKPSTPHRFHGFICGIFNQNSNPTMAVLVYLVELVAVVMVTLFVALVTTALIISVKLLTLVLYILTPLAYMMISSSTSLGTMLLYNIECFANLTKGSETIDNGVCLPEDAPFD